ncbi:unnamed protein product [Caenorhabditis auriculariae]|uniref:Uncharacterized protein n=1 Tax=Caenorhabditis auriculariae TaxID=2777116 RepID=A0A8S1H4I0_9PELO|nr:unnamed protein product [Caenorhabditis auriculariae]
MNPATYASDAYLYIHHFSTRPSAATPLAVLDTSWKTHVGVPFSAGPLVRRAEFFPAGEALSFFLWLLILSIVDD